jgi:membrane protein required for colicin V production
VALLDWIAVALIVVSMLFGLVRGLVFEVISLVGWVVAFVVAQWFASDVAAWLPAGDPQASWRYPLAFVLLFVAVAFGVGLVASLTRKLIAAVGLRPVDRILGGAFGAARGIAEPEACIARKIGKLPALRGSLHVWNRRRCQQRTRQPAAL